MGKIRKNYSASFKAKVALETVKKEKTISHFSFLKGAFGKSRKRGVITKDD